MNTTPTTGVSKTKTQEEIDDAAFPAKEYKKSIFTFSKEELAELKPLEDACQLVITLQTLGLIAQKEKDNYVGSQVLSRLQVKRSEDAKYNYDLKNNRIIVYEPRLICTACLTRKAEYTYQEKIYCVVCIEKIKSELAKPVTLPEEQVSPQERVFHQKTETATRPKKGEKQETQTPSKK